MILFFIRKLLVIERSLLIMDLRNAISMMQKRLHIHLSQEQLDIVIYDIRTSMLIDACAGSGKTMLLLFLTILQVVTGRCNANEILGITFSRRARLDMQSRYRKNARMIKLPSNNMPYFSTFHALFYRLLLQTNQLKNTSVLVSYYPIQFYLSRHIVFHSQVISDSDLLDTIFQDHDQIINHGFSFDGLTVRHDANQEALREGTNIPKLLLKVKEPDNVQETQLVTNYRHVINAYNDYKQQHGQIDFADMMILLYKLVSSNVDVKHSVRKIMSHFKIVFMDEFQDISKLQWELMNMILSPTALKHLVAIGDDDQSIYSFRGSDPKIILNFHNNYPQSKVFNLSTNYRTGGNILSAVRPLIESNKYRLTKHLLTAHHGKGRIIECFSNDRRYSANKILLLKLYQQIKNPNIDNKDIAVLVHFNNSRAFVIDWLASHGLFIKTTNPNYLLQNNSIYKALMSIAKGLLTNNFNYIHRYASKLGFGAYKAHMNKITKHANIHNDLSMYCTIANRLNGLKRNHNTHLDKLLGNYAHRIQNPSRIYKNNLGSLIWMAINSLTDKYFKYMIKNKYINQDLLDSICRYLSRELEHLSTSTDVLNFFKNERTKVSVLTSNNHVHSNIHIMSLHQSKGLQFKYVYLYDLNNRQNTSKEVAINHYFAPNLSMYQFLKFIMNKPLDAIKKIEQNIYQDDKTHAFTLLSTRISILMLKHDDWSDQTLIGKVIAMDLHKNTEESAIEEQAWQIYHNVIHTSQGVEEQRRLIYVGATRAEQRLFLAYNRDADPLLKELDVNNDDKYYLESNGRILSYKDNQKYQQIIQKIRNKLMNN